MEGLRWKGLEADGDFAGGRFSLILTCSAPLEGGVNTPMFSIPSFFDCFLSIPTTSSESQFFIRCALPTLYTLVSPKSWTLAGVSELN